MGNAKDRNTDIKASEFERRIRRLFSDDVSKSEQDIIRAWLASDEDACLKRDSLCRVMLSHFEVDMGFGADGLDEATRVLGFEDIPEDAGRFGQAEKKR